MTPRSRCWSQLRPSWVQLAPKWHSASTQIRGLGPSWRGSSSEVDDQTCKTISKSSRDPLQATIFIDFAIENHSIQSKILDIQQSIFQHSLKPKGPAAEALAIKSAAPIRRIAAGVFVKPPGTIRSRGEAPPPSSAFLPPVPEPKIQPKSVPNPVF